MIDQNAKEKILQADLSNIVRKVKAGKPLTASERKLIDEESQRAPAKNGKTKADAPREMEASALSATLQAWATALGMERRTLEGRLVKHGIVLVKGQRLSARTILTALLGDKEAETIRNLKADADRKEREEQEARGALVKMEEVEKVLAELVILPLRNALMAAPTTLDTLTNPTDPELARRAVQQWVDETLKLLREKLT